MKYKVGDKARVLKDLKINSKYGNCKFMFDMVSMLGKTVTIKAVYDKHYAIEEFGYPWSDEMLEPITTKTVLTTTDVINAATEAFKKYITDILDPRD